MELFSVFGKIGLNDKEFNQGIASAEKSGESFAAKLGSTIAKGAAVVATAVAAIGTAAIVTGVQYDTSLSAIRARTNMTQEDIDRLGIAFRDMGLKGNYSAQEIASAYASIAVNGQTATYGIQVMDQAMTMAQATGNDLGDTAYFLGNYLLKVGKDSSYAEKYVNIFSQGIANTGIGLDSLQNYVFRMTPAFQQFGADAEVNIAILTRLYQAGIKGANLYSGMGTIMMEFGTQSGNAFDAVSEFAEGIIGSSWAAMDNEEKMFAAAKAMAEYGDQTHVAQIVTDSMNSTQQAAWFAFMELSEEIKGTTIPTLREANNEVDGYTASMRMATERSQDFGSALGGIKNSGQDMLKTVWEIIKAPLTGVLETAADKMRNLAVRLREGGDLHPVMKKLGDVISKLAEIIVKLVSKSIEPLIKILSVLGTILVTTLDLMIKWAPVILTVTAAILGLKAGMIITEKIGLLSAAITLAKGKLALYALGAKAATVANASAATGAGALAAALKVKSLATVLATGAFKAFTVALYNVPVIGWILAAIAALTAGIILLVKWFNRETEASQATREETARLAQEREAATERTNNFIDSLKNSAAAHENNMSSMQAEITVSKNLIDRIDELNKMENLSAEQKAELSAMVTLLNENMGETVATINQETGRLNENVQAIRRRIDALADEARAAAMRERLNQVMIEQLKIEEELEYQTNRQAEATARYNAIQDELNDGTRRTRQEKKALEEALAEASAASWEAHDAVAALTEQYERNEGSIDSLTGSIVDNEMATQSATEAVDDYCEALEELREKAIKEAEAALEMLANKFEEVQNRAGDAFNRLDHKVSSSIEKMAETLNKNAEDTEKWGENIAILMEAAMARGVDDGVLNSLLEMAEKGPGYAAMFAADVESTLDQLVPALENVAESSMSYMANVYQTDRSVIEAAAGTVEGTHTAMLAAVSNADFSTIGVSVSDSYATGISRGTPQAVAASQDMGHDTRDGLLNVNQQGSPSQVYINIGQGVSESYASGISDRITVAVQAITDLANQVHTAFLNAITGHNYFAKGQSKVDDLIRGMNDKKSSAVSTANTIAGDISTAFDTTITSNNYFAKGQNIIDSLKNGMLNRESSLMAEAERIANRIAKTIGDALKEGSPMKVFVDKGKNIPDSMAIGIDRNADNALKSASTLAKKIINISDVYGDYGNMSKSNMYAAKANGHAGGGDSAYHFHMNTRPMTPHEAMVACRGQFEMARWTA